MSPVQPRIDDLVLCMTGSRQALCVCSLCRQAYATTPALASGACRCSLLARREDIFSEIDILCGLKHENVIYLKEYFEEGNKVRTPVTSTVHSAQAR